MFTVSNPLLEIVLSNPSIAKTFHLKIDSEAELSPSISNSSCESI